ncbi:unnamed protein product [Mytilus coruscus]|uniref:Uncharacterized protein n=1 Tax=Mytilus coruscus TaxID=42192 RepID=A0A6J8C5Z2_MYTCO|nr:unnamed protein product [Mytilus coruscus]
MLLIVFTFLILTGESYGIECLRCTDAVVNSSSIPSAVRYLLKTFESTYRTPECEKAQTAQAASDVTLNTCTDAPGPGQVNRCGRLVGTLKVLIDPLLVGKIEFPVHFHIRGCFIVEQSLGGGCYRDKRIIDQQRGVLSNVLKGIATLQLGVFNGVLCINGANNLDAWGTNGTIRHAYSWATIFLCAIASMVVLNKTY